MTPLNATDDSAYGTDLIRGGRGPVPMARAAVLAAAALAAVGCASASGGRPVPRPFPMPPASAGRPVPPPVEPGLPADDTLHPVGPAPPVIVTALDLLGSPYRNGGSTPDGFDCSGFTQWVFARHGVRLPRETREQFGEGEAVAPAALAPGDLVFFSTVAPGPSHVAIALDADRFVHAPSSNGVVRIERLSTSYWSRRFIGARRLELAN